MSNGQLIFVLMGVVAFLACGWMVWVACRVEKAVTYDADDLAPSDEFPRAYDPDSYAA